MGKRIIQQRRGRGTNTYKAKKRSFKYKLQYPTNLSEKAVVLKLISSAAHTAPLAKIQSGKEVFFIPAFEKMYEGQEISYNKEIKQGNIMELKDIPVKTKIYCIESNPRDGGKYIKTGGTCGILNRIIGNFGYVVMPSKKEKKFNLKCRAIIGKIAGAGRLDKPIIKAGKQYYIKKSKNKLWPRTSAVKMNAVDHPFGSGRAKNPKSKIPKRNASPGKKVGLLKPRRTGKRK